MKKSLLFILLITYAFSILKPTLPFVCDIVAHVLFFHHHINTVHKVNGKQHVHYEMIKEAKKESKESGHSGIQKVNTTDDHPFLPFHNKFISYDKAEKIFWPETIKLFSRSISNNYPPPKLQFV